MKATIVVCLLLALILAAVALAVWLIRLDRKAKARRDEDCMRLWEVVHSAKADNIMEDTVDVP